MKKQLNLFSFNIFLFVLLQFFLANAQTDNGTLQNSITTPQEPLAPPNWLNSSSTQLTKFMLDRYNYYVTPKGNRIWSAAMDLAWNQLKRSFLFGENAIFNDTNSLQQKIVDNYNTEKFTRDQLQEDSYYVGSGYGPEAQKKINFQVKEKFPNKMFPPLEFDLKDKDFLVYTYFQKMFQYKTPFSDCPYFKFKGVQVQAFQALTKKQKKQLYYKYYNNENDFLMGIETANNKDEILILKSNSSYFANIKMQKVQKLIDIYSKLPNYKFKMIDQFKMPVLNFDYERKFDEMSGLYFKNEIMKDYMIGKMQERLKFRMDRFGVKIVNDAAIIVLGINFYLDAKYFILNKDFWVIFKEKNKKPYLIMQVKAVNEAWP